jgi:hypothetical protein
MEHIPLYEGPAIRELAATLARKACQESRRYDKAATRYRLLQYVLQGSILYFPCAAVVIVTIPALPKGVSSIILGLFVLALEAVREGLGSQFGRMSLRGEMWYNRSTCIKKRWEVRRNEP